MKLYLIPIFILFFSQGLFGSTWQINKDHSEIFFKVPYLNISEVTGRFKKFDGFTKLNAKGYPEEVSVSIDSSSVDTGNSLRDGHLRGHDFFQSGTHPQIIFKSKTVQAIKGNQYKATGTLTIRKVTRPFILIFSLSSPVKDTWNKTSVFVSFSSSLKKSDFGIVWNKNIPGQEYLVGENVSFWGTFQLQEISAKTPSNNHMIPDTAYIRERDQIRRGEAPSVESASLTPVPVLVEKKLIEDSMIKKVPQVLQVEKKSKSFLWWLSLSVIGLFGFLALIIVTFYSKNILNEYFPRNYEENGLWGYVSDVVVILSVVIFAMAFWNVGWGN